MKNILTCKIQIKLTNKQITIQTYDDISCYIMTLPTLSFWQGTRGGTTSYGVALGIVIVVGVGVVDVDICS